MNLSAPKQFRSKEISKSNVVDDMVESNQVLYDPQEKPDHCVSVAFSLAVLSIANIHSELGCIATKFVLQYNYYDAADT